MAVRWYLRYGLSYRDVQELLAERGVEVDHVPVYRWVHRLAPLFADAARPCRHLPGDRWFVDETYVKVDGVWRYVYRAVDQYGQVIDVLVVARRDANAARRFFTRALTTLKVTPSEVVTDAAPVYPRVLDELVPAVWHHVVQYANNRVEADHSRLKHRLRPMRGLRTDRTARVIIAAIAFVQNLGRGHYDLATEAPGPLRVAAAFAELAERFDIPFRTHHAGHRPANATQPVSFTSGGAPIAVPRGDGSLSGDGPLTAADYTDLIAAP